MQALLLTATASQKPTMSMLKQRRMQHLETRAGQDQRRQAGTVTAPGEQGNAATLAHGAWHAIILHNSSQSATQGTGRITACTVCTLLQQVAGPARPECGQHAALPPLLPRHNTLFRLLPGVGCLTNLVMLNTGWLAL